MLTNNNVLPTSNTKLYLIKKSTTINPTFKIDRIDTDARMTDFITLPKGKCGGNGKARGLMNGTQVLYN